MDRIFAKGGAIEALIQAREQKLVRFIGVTGHADPDVLIAAIQRFPFDMVLIALNAADLVVAATPVDLARLIPLDKRVIRARYEFAETSGPSLGAIVDAWVFRAIQAR